jgi:hypothetical protein
MGSRLAPHFAFAQKWLWLKSCSRGDAPGGVRFGDAGDDAGAMMRGAAIAQGYDGLQRVWLKQFAVQLLLPLQQWPAPQRVQGKTTFFSRSISR